MSTAYLNGRFLPLAEASVSVLDRGFLFGDGVYEVIPCFSGRLFRLPHHMKRMAASLAAVRIDNPLAGEAGERMLEQLVAANGGGNLSVYVQITRGVAPRDQPFPVPPPPPTVFAMANPLASQVPAPAAAITAEDIRWKRCDIKSTSLLANCMLRQAAVDAGAQETILLRDGWVTEGSASNVFAVIDGVVRTPPLSHALLPGITRDVVVEVLRANGDAIEEAPISEDALRRAQEIWITSSTRDLVPIVRLDGEPVGSGEPGPAWRQALDLYQQFKRDFVA